MDSVVFHREKQKHPQKNIIYTIYKFNKLL